MRAASSVSRVVPLLAAVLLAACSAAPASPGGQAPLHSTAGSKPSVTTGQVATPASLDKLYQAAKAEGAVTWQAGPLSQASGDIGQAFMQHYPGIEVTYSPINDPQVPGLVITETSAGNHTVQSLDIAHGGAQIFKPLVDRDMLLSTDWSTLGVDAGSSLLDGRWLVNEDGITVWIYNTKMVQPADVPRQWNDLLNPRWKGKIAINASADGLSQLFFSMGEEQAKVYLTALKGQQLTVTKSKGPGREMVTSGQVNVAMANIADVVRAKPTGAPVEAASIGPMLHDPRGWYIPSAVHHPNAARLFAAWMVSPEGLSIQDKKAGLSKATPCSASDVAKYVCDHNITYIDEQTQHMDLFAFYDKIAQYEDQAAELLGTQPSKATS